MFLTELTFVITLSVLLVAIVSLGFYFLLGIVGMLLTPVPFVPSAHRTIEKATELLRITDTSVVYDLGCGNGKVVYYIARRHPKARIVGVEVAPLPYLLAIIIGLHRRTSNTRIMFTNFSRVDLRTATHLYLYLFPQTVAALVPKLEAELPRGARVVACDFPIRNRTPSDTVIVGEGLRTHTLYAYDF